MLQGPQGLITLPESNTTSIGRKSSLSHSSSLSFIVDKRCSRHQADIINKSGRVRLISRGTNPTVVHKEGRRENPIFLKTGEHIDLEKGDCVSFAIPEYSFIFTPLGSNKRKSITTTPPSNKKIKTGITMMDNLSDNQNKNNNNNNSNNNNNNNNFNNNIFYEPDLEMDDHPTKNNINNITSSSSSSSSSSSKSGAPLLMLIPYCKNPADPEHGKAIVQYDDKLVVINDKFPKAEYHFLVMPRELIDGPHRLTSKHVELVQSMIDCADKLIKKINKGKDKTVKFSVGFHAVPSMRQLHMHVISTDMNSPMMKNKKHWNSFTTRFFIDAKVFLQMLSDNGFVKFEKEKYEPLLKQPLKCHLCQTQISNIPSLKSHINSCIGN